MTRVTAAQARDLVHSGCEIAFLDIREAGQFVDGHAMFAIPLPYSGLELAIARLVPRATTPIVLVDAGDGVADRAVDCLEAMGYRTIMTVEGGMPAWAEPGFPVYKGVNVPSKTLGELAETLWHPKTVTADELAAMLERGDDPAFFDVRPAAEYQKMRVPHACWLPNGELPHRIQALGVREDQTVVMTCAGRTRGIVGAIAMRAAGYDIEVAALENGTQGWALSGRDLLRGNDVPPLPQLSTGHLLASRARASAMMTRFDLPGADGELVSAMLADADRTTFVFDVRSEQETGSDPVASARAVPGVQLVQATDQFIGVRGARVVVACDTGLRSAIAAFWLTQLGYEVFVSTLDELRHVRSGANGSDHVFGDVPWVTARQIKADPDAYLLVDVRGSMAYRAGHISGAVWSLRPLLPGSLEPGEDRIIVFVDGDDGKAILCARDALRPGMGAVRVCRGGHPALVQAGLQVVASPNSPTDAQAIDFAFFVHDRHDGNLEASRRYLEWETGLIVQMDAVEREAFRLKRPQESA